MVCGSGLSTTWSRGKCSARLVGQIVPVGAEKRITQSPSPQARPSDPQHDHVLEPLSEPLGQRLDLIHRLGCAREVQEPEHALCTLRPHALQGLSQGGTHGALHVRLGDASTEAWCHEIPVVESYLAHSISTCSPS